MRNIELESPEIPTARRYVPIPLPEGADRQIVSVGRDDDQIVLGTTDGDEWIIFTAAPGAFGQPTAHQHLFDGGLFGIETREEEKGGAVAIVNTHRKEDDSESESFQPTAYGPRGVPIHPKLYTPYPLATIQVHEEKTVFVIKNGMEEYLLVTVPGDEGRKKYPKELHMVAEHPERFVFRSTSQGVTISPNNTP